MKRVMVVSPYEHYPEVASFRLRLLALVEPMKRRGYDWIIRVRPSTPWGRIALARSARHYDAVILHKKMMDPYETRFLRRNAPPPGRIFMDIDDATMVHETKLGRLARRRLDRRFHATAKILDVACCGNDYLARIFKSRGRAVAYLPTVVAPEDYSIRNHEPAALIRLVWIGSGSTRKYLEHAMPSLGQAAEKLRSQGVELRVIVIGDRPPKGATLPVEFVPWTLAGEAPAIVQGDIGIAPTPKTPFTLGKCGFKIVQYLAAGLPVVASAVGANVALVNGKNEQQCAGFLVNDWSESPAAIERLALDADLRRRMGAAGRRRIEEELCVEKMADIWGARSPETSDTSDGLLISMDIALLVQNADARLGGAEQYTLDLARALALRGHGVTVIAQHGPAAAASPGYRCLYLGAAGRSRWSRLRSFLIRADALYERGRYQIVHAMLPVWRCDVYQPHAGLAADCLATGHLKHPHALMQRLARLANHINSKRTGLARVEHALMRLNPYVLCFSSMMRRAARRHFSLPEDRLIPLINGIDLARFDPTFTAPARAALREQWKIPPAHRVGLLVGHNWKLKGVHEAIQALRDAGDDHLILMVVGRDATKTYQKHARKAGVAHRVTFLGPVADQRPLYAAADFLLLPTRRDTCSLVVLEALAMGLPVITTRQNGASELIEHGRHGLLTDRGDSAALARAMQTMLDPATRRNMSREALALRHRLSFDSHVATIESIYQKVLNQREPPMPAVNAASRRISFPIPTLTDSPQ